MKEDRRTTVLTARIVDLEAWIMTANHFAWAHERDCPRHDADEPCTCGLDAFLSRPRPVIESFQQQITELQAELADETALRIILTKRMDEFSAIWKAHHPEEQGLVWPDVATTFEFVAKLLAAAPHSDLCANRMSHTMKCDCWKATPSG